MYAEKEQFFQPNFLLYYSNFALERMSWYEIQQYIRYSETS